MLIFARSALTRLDRCAELVERSRLGGQGTLAIGAIMGAAPDLVAQAIIDLKRQQPLLQIRLMGETSDQLMEWLEHSRIDLAVARFASPLQHNRFEFEALGNETLLTVVRRDHPLIDTMAAQDPPELSELLEQWPWIMQPIASPARQTLEHEFERLGLCSPRDTIECDSIFAALQLVQRSDAVLAMAESVVRDHLQSDLIRALPIRIGTTLAPYGLLTRRGEPISAAALAFREQLRQRAQALPPL
ncbi:LysR substrate-binding domain-containing protein [Kushneria sinocarnis]|uniref:LysR substrate-binding domain-containing protein n=1 Tax=Kushneria sinocarnis TaxID=595502 RepID=UPI001B882AA3|nr:LysR substrate-binding domain-containing protein [Kushneria sinocarnis]